MKRLTFIAVACFLSLGSSAFAQVATWKDVQAEPDPERKSRLALDLALASVDAVVDAYRGGLPEQARAMSARIVEATELSLEALEESGKNARKKPKHFKRAELATRKLARNLKSAQRQLIYDERQDLEPVIQRIEEINGQILMDIMQAK